MPPLIAFVRRVAKAYWTDAGRTAARNLAWLAVITVGTRLCGLGSVFFLTHGLGQEAFGIFIAALTLQSYLLLLGCVGVNRISIRDGSQQPEQLDTIETTRVVVTGAASVALFAVTALVAWFTPMSGAERILILLISAGNIALCLDMRCLFDVQHRQPHSSAITLVAEVVALAAILEMWYLDRLSLPVAGVIFVTKWTLGSVGQFVVYHATIRPWRWMKSATHIRQTLRSGWPLMLSGLVASIPLTSGIFFVRWFHGDADAAILGLAQQVAVAYMVFCAIGTRILQPHIAGPYGSTRSFIKKMVLFIALFHSAVLAAALGASTILILGLLPPSYEAAVLPAAILMIGRMIASVGAIGGMYAVTQMRETIILRAHVSGAIVFAVGCVLLVPHGSYLASAWVSLAASVCSVGLIFLGLYRADR